MKFATRSIMAFASFICFALCSCSKETSSLSIQLANWQYAPCHSAELSSAITSSDAFAPLPLNSMNKLAQLLPKECGYIMLKSNFTLPTSLQHEEIGFYAGKICIAAHVYINGQLIGTRGKFPPHEFCGGTGASWYFVPNAFLNKSGSNEVTMILWVEGSGGITSLPFISTAKKVEMRAKQRSFLMSEMNMLFMATITVIALFYLMLYFKWIQEKEYLWYAITNLCTAFYLLPFCQSEAPWLMQPWTWLAFNKTCTGVIAFITAYFATTFIRTFLKRKDSPTLIITRLVLLIIPCVWVMLLPSYLSFWHSLPILFAFIALQMTFAVTAVVDSLIKKQPEILKLLFGFSPVLLTVAVDAVIQGVLKKDTLPYFTIYGWQATNILFLVILVDRFNKMRQRVEYLNVKLETEVAERTSDLTEANAELEAEQHRAAQDMDLAVHVQQSFYPTIVKYPGWDIAVYFKPLSGVSGDLYDLYQVDNKLRGFSLFDVSGHGIAAGLVTMLTKSIFYRSFKANLNNSLTDTLYEINNNVIAAKGNIENYLTGVLFRYDEHQHELQLVNAGSPQPLYHKKGSTQATFMAPPKEEKQCGMIGVTGLAVSFPLVTVHMQEGDSIICYTDGLTEAVNDKNEQFGKNRLRESFASAGDIPANECVKKIISDLHTFIGETPLGDDLTFLIIKKTEEPQIEELESI
jgi:sigma-B regulation protein RsbU (phosphoserine phosphatase)